MDRHGQRRRDGKPCISSDVTSAEMIDERSRLLQKSRTDHDDDESNLPHEYRILAQLTLPVTITSIMRNVIGASTIVAVAKLGELSILRRKSLILTRFDRHGGTCSCQPGILNE